MAFLLLETGLRSFPFVGRMLGMALLGPTVSSNVAVSLHAVSGVSKILAHTSSILPLTIANLAHRCSIMAIEDVALSNGAQRERERRLHNREACKRLHCACVQRAKSPVSVLMPSSRQVGPTHLCLWASVVSQLRTFPVRCFGKQRILLAPLLDVNTGGVLSLDVQTALLSHAVFERWPAVLAVSEEHAFASGMRVFRPMFKGHTECAGLSKLSQDFKVFGR